MANTRGPIPERNPTPTQEKTQKKNRKRSIPQKKEDASPESILATDEVMPILPKDTPAEVEAMYNQLYPLLKAENLIMPIHKDYLRQYCELSVLTAKAAKGIFHKIEKMKKRLKNDPLAWMVEEDARGNKKEAPELKSFRQMVAVTKAHGSALGMDPVAYVRLCLGAHDDLVVTQKAQSIIDSIRDDK